MNASSSLATRSSLTTSLRGCRPGRMRWNWVDSRQIQTRSAEAAGGGRATPTRPRRQGSKGERRSSEAEEAGGGSERPGVAAVLRCVAVAAAARGSCTRTPDTCLEWAARRLRKAGCAGRARKGKARREGASSAKSHRGRETVRVRELHLPLPPLTSAAGPGPSSACPCRPRFTSTNTRWCAAPRLSVVAACARRSPTNPPCCDSTTMAEPPAKRPAVEPPAADEATAATSSSGRTVGRAPASRA